MFAILDDHFASLPDRDALDLGDGYSSLLKPSARVAAELVAAGAKWRHLNYFTFKSLVNHMGSLPAPPVIVETGSSAEGTNSSVLFARLASALGGQFQTVDLCPETTARIQHTLRGVPGCSCYCGDSVAFLEAYAGAPPTVAYLDSWGLDPGQFEASAAHGLAEFEALVPKLDKRLAFILVDDTPSSREIFRKCVSPDYMVELDAYVRATGRLPGKGELIVEAIRGDPRFTVLAWQYQLLLRYSDN